jgi:membrane protease subunit (stomatin/prohibitin family)
MTARGHFSFHIMDPEKFIRNVVGTDGEFTKEEIEDRLRKRFVTEAISGIAESGKSFYDMAQHYDDLSQILKERVDPIFLEKYGIGLDDTSIQSIDLTERSAEKVEKRDELMFAGSRMNDYERKARADAMLGLANNEGMGGGMAAGGMGMGMGMAMAGQMGGGQNQYQAQPQRGMAPPPPPMPAAFFVFINGQQTGPMGMQQLQQMVAQGQVTGKSQVWKQGMPAWAMLSTVPELAGLLSSGSTPPPPPPS